MKIAVLFPGQGSQYVGMGEEFLAQSDSCAELMDMAAEVFADDLKSLCLQGPLETLTESMNVQPAITVTNLICWQAFREALGTDLPVSAFAGHSLGEYSALYASGAVSAEDTMRLVCKRGLLMHREGQKRPGGMRAVLGLGVEQVDSLIERYDGDGIVTVANHNTSQQIVISGTNDALDWLSQAASQENARVIPLNVSIANHSPLLADAVEEFADLLTKTRLRSPEIPVYFNVTAGKEADPQKIKEIMAGQIVSRVRWYESITAMINDGIDTFIEVGPKSVLKGMMKKFQNREKSIRSLQVDNPASLEKCIHVVQRS